jgi:hypothetical protein
MPRPHTRFAMVSRRSCSTHGRSISTRTASSNTSIPAGDPLPHYRRDEVQGVPLPVVIKPAKEDAELGLQTADATVEPAPCLLPAQDLAIVERLHRFGSAWASSRSRSRAMIWINASIGGLFFGGVPSFDPQLVLFVPVLDRQFGIAVEAVVTGADLRFDPACFVAQQQMHAQRRLG